MATTAIRSLFAALAAGFLLAACGGGGGGTLSTPPQSIQPAQPVTTAAAPFTGAAVDRGTGFDGQPRLRALSAADVPKPVFGVTFVPLGQVHRSAQALAVEATPGRTMTPDELMNGAERVYGSLFPPQPASQEGVANGMTFRFRFYAATGWYLGVVTAGPNLGHVYTLKDSVLTDHGTSAYWSCQFEPSRCGPTITAARLVLADGTSRPAAGAVDVPAKGTKLVTAWSESLACAGVAGEGKVGDLWMKVECSGAELSFMPGRSGEERWPFGSTNTVTMTGVRGASNFPSATESVSFTTRAAGVGGGAKVFAANYNANGDPTSSSYGAAVTVLNSNGTSQMVRLPGLPASSMWGTLQRLSIDPVMGVVYVGGAGLSLYRLDLETGEVLRSLDLILPEAPWHIIQGIAFQGDDVCVAMGRRDFVDYASKGVLSCWSRYTLDRTFKSATNHLVPGDMVVMDLVPVPERKTYYAVAYETSAYGLIMGEGGGLREEIAPGSKGLVVEVDAETKAIKRTFTVGAGPRSVVYDAARSRLIVANSGDRTLSLIDLSSGNVVTRALSGFTGYQRPMQLKIVGGELWMSNYDRQLVALHLDILQETRRVTAGLLSEYFDFVAGEFYSTRDGFGTITITNPSTGAVRALQGTLGPWFIVGYAPPQ